MWHVVAEFIAESNASLVTFDSDDRISETKLSNEMARKKSRKFPSLGHCSIYYLYTGDSSCGCFHKGKERTFGATDGVYFLTQGFAHTCNLQGVPKAQSMRILFLEYNSRWIHSMEFQ